MNQTDFAVMYVFSLSSFPSSFSPSVLSAQIRVSPPVWCVSAGCSRLDGRSAALAPTRAIAAANKQESHAWYARGEREGTHGVCVRCAAGRVRSLPPGAISVPMRASAPPRRRSVCPTEAAPSLTAHSPQLHPLSRVSSSPPCPSSLPSLAALPRARPARSPRAPPSVTSDGECTDSIRPVDTAPCDYHDSASTAHAHGHHLTRIFCMRPRVCSVRLPRRVCVGASS